MVKTKKQKNKALATYQKNQAIVKGKLFEAVLSKLLLKAGFSTDIESDQITKNRRRLHGRGSTYDPDFFGKFRVGIPFINPLMLVAEAKYYNSPVHLNKVREFLGAYIDFSQYNRVNTKAGGEKRYSVLYSPRYTYCPVFFSIKGFDKSARGFMFAHGINYISYENSEIIYKTHVLIERLLGTINFSKFQTEDFKFFNELEKMHEIRAELKKKDFDKFFSKFSKYIENINSLIGVLDLKYPVNILHKKNIRVSKSKKIKVTAIKENLFFVENTSGRKFGEFSFNKAFLKDYVSYAKRNNSLDQILNQIDIILPQKDIVEIKQFLIEENSRRVLLASLLKEKSLATNQISVKENTASSPTEKNNQSGNGPEFNRAHSSEGGN